MDPKPRSFRLDFQSTGSASIWPTWLTVASRFLWETSSPQNTQRGQELTTAIWEQILGQLGCSQLQVTESLNSKYLWESLLSHITRKPRDGKKELHTGYFSIPIFPSGFLRAVPPYVLADGKIDTDISRHHSWMKKRDCLLGLWVSLSEVRKPFPTGPLQSFIHVSSGISTWPGLPHTMEAGCHQQRERETERSRWKSYLLS